ncbi:MAG: universal stress protein [Alphaproteobacteria bacterium]|nr:universal stress protein [Alphaproteobacteria bacterium]
MAIPDSRLQRGEVHRILWMTDLSERAAACEAAVRWFAALATARGDDPAQVIVAHALGVEAGESPERHEARKAEAKAHLAALAGDLESVGISSQAVVSRGRASEVTRTLADEHDVDLVVIGRTGVSGIDRVLLGSTARRIVREAGRAVLAVAHDGFGVPQRIACPVDPTDTKAADASDAGIRVAAALGRAAGARVTFLSVALATGFVPEDRLEVGHRLERKVARVLGDPSDLDHGVRVIISQAISDGVAEASHHADLLVIGTAGRRGLARLVLGSVAEDLVERCPITVLVAH